jgi:peptidoglycan/xylan/chitin deacetylase (PgdA/CDA1 family)
VEQPTATSSCALPILMYHSLDTSQSVVSVSPQRFAEHMACLANLGVRGIGLRDALVHHAAHGMWPERAVVITFDDGYANFFEHGLPTLQQYGFTATVFQVTGFVGQRNDWGPPPAGLGTLPILAWPQLREMSAAGIEIGAHTRTHPDLRGLPAEAVERELAGSRTDIEQHVGTAVWTCAYPFGAFDGPSLRIAGQEFRAACTTVLARARGEPLHRLPRVDMYYVRRPGDLARLVCGQLDRYLTVRRWGRRVRPILHGGAFVE